MHLRMLSKKDLSIALVHRLDHVPRYIAMIREYPQLLKQALSRGITQPCK